LYQKEWLFNARRTVAATKRPPAASAYSDLISVPAVTRSRKVDVLATRYASK
jgi:hypothetical protein